MHPLKPPTDTKAWPIWLLRIWLNEQRVFLSLDVFPKPSPPAKAQRGAGKLFSVLFGWRLSCYDICLQNNKKKTCGKCEDCGHLPRKKPCLITASQKQSWPMNTLLREKRTVLPTIGSNLYSFRYQPKKREKRAETKQVFCWKKTKAL